MSTRLLHWPILVALVASLALAGCASEQQVLALKKRVDALEKQNADLQRRLDAVDKGGSGGGPLGQLGGLVGLIGQLAKNARPRPGAVGKPYPSRRSTQLDPALQARLDKLVVDSLEKLAKSDDAKSLVKTMLRAMRRDVEAGPRSAAPAGSARPRVGRGGAGSLPLPIPPPPKPKQKKTQP